MIRVLTAGWMTALMSRLDRALELASFGASHGMTAGRPR